MRPFPHTDTCFVPNRDSAPLQHRGPADSAPSSTQSAPSPHRPLTGQAHSGEGGQRTAGRLRAGPFLFSLVLHGTVLLAASLLVNRMDYPPKPLPPVLNISLELVDDHPGKPGEGTGTRPTGQSSVPAAPKAAPPQQAKRPPKKPVAATRQPAAKQPARKVSRPVALNPPPKNPKKSELPQTLPQTPSRKPVSSGPTTSEGNQETPTGSGALSGATGSTSTGGGVGTDRTGGNGAKAGGGRNAGAGYDFNAVRQRILDNLRFPAVARKMGLTGTTVVAFVLLPDGRVEQPTIVSSSGHPILDKAVISTIQRISPFPPPPARTRLVVPVVFTLQR
jgi:TonB family protein